MHPPAPASHPAAYNCCSCEIDHDPSPCAPQQPMATRHRTCTATDKHGASTTTLANKHHRKTARVSSQSLIASPFITHRVRPMQIGSEVGNGRDCASLSGEFSLQVRLHTIWFAKNICAGEHQKHLGPVVWAVTLDLPRPVQERHSPGRLCTRWRRGASAIPASSCAVGETGEKRRRCHC